MAYFVFLDDRKLVTSCIPGKKSKHTWTVNLDNLILHVAGSNFHRTIYIWPHDRFFHTWPHQVRRQNVVFSTNGWTVPSHHGFSTRPSSKILFYGITFGAGWFMHPVDFLFWHILGEFTWNNKPLVLEGNLSTYISRHWHSRWANDYPETLIFVGGKCSKNLFEPMCPVEAHWVVKILSIGFCQGRTRAPKTLLKCFEPHQASVWLKNPFWMTRHLNVRMFVRREWFETALGMFQTLQIIGNVLKL